MREIRSRRGFTLLEFIVLVCIVLLLAALLLPALQKARQTALRVACANRLKQLGTASHAYHDALGHLPPALGPCPDLIAGPNFTFFFHLLPFVEQDDLHRRARGDADALATPVPLYLCPADPSAGRDHVKAGGLSRSYSLGSYAVNAQVVCRVDASGRVIDPSGKTSLGRDVPDGTSLTVLFAEKLALCTNPANPEGGCLPMFGETDATVAVPYYPAIAFHRNSGSVGRGAIFQIRPHERRCDPTIASSAHDVMPVGLADGSVRSCRADVSGHIWWEYLTPDGGEAVPPPRQARPRGTPR